jgi:hypothetical protein
MIGVKGDYGSNPCQGLSDGSNPTRQHDVQGEVLAITLAPAKGLPDSGDPIGHHGV